MTAIRIHKRIDSETLHLPELSPLIGKAVELMVTEVIPATREEFYGEAAHIPQTLAEWTTQQEKFRAWRSDPRFERFWPLLDGWLTKEVADVMDRDTTRRDEAAS